MNLESGTAIQWTKQIGKAPFLSNKKTWYQCLSAQLLPAPGTALRHGVKGWLSQPLNKYFKSHSYCYFEMRKWGKVERINKCVLIRSCHWNSLPAQLTLLHLRTSEIFTNVVESHLTTPVGPKSLILKSRVVFSWMCLEFGSVTHF